MGDAGLGLDGHDPELFLFRTGPILSGVSRGVFDRGRLTDRRELLPAAASPALEWMRVRPRRLAAILLGCPRGRAENPRLRPGEPALRRARVRAGRRRAARHLS